MSESEDFTPRHCRLCRCTDISACRHVDGTPCGWFDNETCSVCAGYLYDNPVFEEIGAVRWDQDRRKSFRLGALTTAGLAGTARVVLSLVTLQPDDDPCLNRERLIEAAALIVAAVEALDREAAAKTTDREIATVEGHGMGETGGKGTRSDGPPEIVA